MHHASIQHRRGHTGREVGAETKHHFQNKRKLCFDAVSYFTAMPTTEVHTPLKRDRKQPKTHPINYHLSIELEIMYFSLDRQLGSSSTPHVGDKNVFLGLVWCDGTGLRTDTALMHLV